MLLTLRLLNPLPSAGRLMLVRATSPMVLPGNEDNDEVHVWVESQAS